MESRIIQIGIRFVREYYERLIADPDKLYEFFNENSYLTIGRTNTILPESVSSLQEINKKIQSQNFKESDVQILTVDCQESVEGAIFILVTGILQNRKFVQSFLLISHQQQKQYSLQNSIIRFLEDGSEQPVPPNVNTLHSEQESMLTPHSQPAPNVEEQPIKVDTTPSETPTPKSSQQGESSNHTPETPPTSAQSPIQTPPVKKPFSWASHGESHHTAQSPSVPHPPAQPPHHQETPMKKTSAAKSDDSYGGSKSDYKGQEFYSIFINNFPPGVTVTEIQIREIFSKMGEIARITLRVDKGYCFVDFKHQDSVKKVLEHIRNTPITINGMAISVAEKKKNKSGGGTKDKPASSGRPSGYSKRQ